MSIEAMAVVLHHSKATATDKVVLLGIANHEGDGGSWPAVATLAKYAQCSERAVRYSLKRLVELGELTVHHQAGGNADTRTDRRPNLYRVRVTCPPDCAGGTDHKSRDEAGFRPNGHGVKQASERGEVGFRNGGQPIAAEPSLEPSMNRQKNRATSMTDEWQPDSDTLDRLKAKHPLLNVSSELDKFRNYYISKAEKRADWNASFRNWLIKADEYGKPKGHQPTGQFPAGSGGVYL